MENNVVETLQKVIRLLVVDDTSGVSQKKFGLFFFSLEELTNFYAFSPHFRKYCLCCLYISRLGKIVHQDTVWHL